MTAPALSRRALLAAGAGALLASACGDPRGEAGVIRIGALSNLTHAPVLAGLESGRLARAVAPLRVETRAFRAGPRVIEALLGCAIDVGISGPAPLVVGYAHHRAAEFRVVSGVASGGASLVTAKRARVAAPGDLRGKSVAVTQLGSTQDVSLRKYLRANGLAPTTRGGDVTIQVLAASDARTQMIRGQLDGAWLPEPWATRLVVEGIADRFVDERDLWPGGRFATALAVARSGFLKARPADAERVIAAIGDEVERARREPERTRAEAYAAIQRQTRSAGTKECFDKAWGEIEFTADPLESAVSAFADDAASLGVMPAVDCAALFEVAAMGVGGRTRA